MQYLRIISAASSPEVKGAGNRTRAAVPTQNRIKGNELERNKFKSRIYRKKGLGDILSVKISRQVCSSLCMNIDQQAAVVMR